MTAAVLAFQVDFLIPDERSLHFDLTPKLRVRHAALTVTYDVTRSGPLLSVLVPGEERAEGEFPTDAIAACIFSRQYGWQPLSAQLAAIELRNWLQQTLEPLVSHLVTWPAEPMTATEERQAYWDRAIALESSVDFTFVVEA